MVSAQLIARACRKIARRHDLFHGNCGVFAIALRQLVGEGGLLAACCLRDDEYDLGGIAHVAYKHPDGTLFDGSGMITREELLEWAKKDYAAQGGQWPEPDIVDLWTRPDPEGEVLKNTSPRVAVDVRAAELRTQLGGMAT